jgi:hypothetical protein
MLFLHLFYKKEMCGSGRIAFLLMVLPIIVVGIYLRCDFNERAKERMILLLYLLSCLNWATYVMFRWLEVERKRKEQKDMDEEHIWATPVCAIGDI